MYKLILRFSKLRYIVSHHWVTGIEQPSICKRFISTGQRFQVLMLIFMYQVFKTIQLLLLDFVSVICIRFSMFVYYIPRLVKSKCLLLRAVKLESENKQRNGIARPSFLFYKPSDYTLCSKLLIFAKLDCCKCQERCIINIFKNSKMFFASAFVYKMHGNSNSASTLTVLSPNLVSLFYTRYSCSSLLAKNFVFASLHGRAFSSFCPNYNSLHLELKLIFTYWHWKSWDRTAVSVVLVNI